MAPQRASTGLTEVPASRRGAPQALRRNGCALYRAGGCELLLTVWTDPVLQTARLFCPWASPPPQSPDFPIGALAAARPERWPEVTTLLARTEGDAAPAGPGWGRERVMVARPQPSPRRPAGPDGVTVRPAGPQDRGAVLGMLLAALRSGYAQAPDERIEAALEHHFLPELARGALRALVAVAGGEVAGHAVYRPEAHDDLTAARHLELVDTYVLPGFVGTGLARLLAAHVEAEAAAAGLPLRGEVICDPGGAWEQLYGNLRRAGWQPAWSMWRAPLTGEGAS